MVNRDVTLEEMLEAMAKLPDGTVFRWYQVTAGFSPEGVPVPGDALRLTLGELRKALK